MSTVNPTKASQNSFCLIAHNAYDVLAKVEDNSHIGGIEVQVPMMSKWFAANGYPTTMISWDSDYEDGIEHDGVVVRKMCKETDGIPWVRFFYPRWTSFISALKRADADVYYYNTGDLGLGQTVYWAHKHGKKVIYSIANDVDCTRALPALKVKRERILYKYGLINADKVVCQTEKQKKLLKDEYDINADVIRMPCAGFEKIENQNFDSESKKHVLWVGRFAPEKRLEYFFELAKLFPDMIFDVVGDFNVGKTAKYAGELRQIAETIPNVVLHGRIAHENMGVFYNKSFLLCSTSVYEGFPNVYLEAWGVGLPLITTFDPDGVVVKYGLGRAVDGVAEMKLAIEEMLDIDKRNGVSKAAEAYFFEHHTLESSMSKFEAQFLGLSNK